MSVTLCGKWLGGSDCSGETKTHRIASAKTDGKGTDPSGKGDQASAVKSQEGCLAFCKLQAGATCCLTEAGRTDEVLP